MLFYVFFCRIRKNFKIMISPYIPKCWNGIMLVGEAPGEDEVRQNEPFVGRSGRFLTEMLFKAGIIRNECYITNTFLERPPDNKIMKFFQSSRKTPEEIIDKCPPYNGYYYPKPELISEWDRLDTEIRENRPKVIAAIGATALWRLTGKSGITKMRGFFEDYCPQGWSFKTSVLITFHPAYVLRNRSVMPVVIEDFKNLNQFIGT